MFCTSCGKKLEGTPKFCPYCGHPIRTTDAPSSDHTEQSVTPIMPDTTSMTPSLSTGDSPQEFNQPAQKDPRHNLVILCGVLAGVALAACIVALVAVVHPFSQPTTSLAAHGAASTQEVASSAAATQQASSMAVSTSSEQTSTKQNVEVVQVPASPQPSTPVQQQQHSAEQGTPIPHMMGRRTCIVPVSYRRTPTMIYLLLVTRYMRAMVGSLTLPNFVTTLSVNPGITGQLLHQILMNQF